MLQSYNDLWGEVSNQAASDRFESFLNRVESLRSTASEP